MKRIDSHVHISLNHEPSTAEDGALLCELLEDVDRINVLNIVLEKAENLPRNGISLLLKLRHPGRVYSFGGIVMSPGRGEAVEYAAQVEQLRRVGFDGVKLFGKPSVRASRPVAFDDPVYDGLYQALSESGTPLNFHIGDPPEFWDQASIPAFARERGWYYGGGGYSSPEGLLAELTHVLERFPDLRLLAPHMLFLSQDLERLGGLLDRFPNMLTDVTPGRELYFQLSKKPEAAREFFLRYRRRILFGTDNAVCVSRPDCLRSCRETLSAIERFLETEDRFQAWGGDLAGLALPEDVLEDLYWGNFIRWAGAEPAAPDPAQAAAYCSELGSFAARLGCGTAQRELDGVAAALAEFSAAR